MASTLRKMPRRRMSPSARAVRSSFTARSWMRPVVRLASRRATSRAMGSASRIAAYARMAIADAEGHQPLHRDELASPNGHHCQHDQRTERHDIEQDGQDERRQPLLERPSGLGRQQVDVGKLAQPGRKQIDEQAARKRDGGQKRPPHAAREEKPEARRPRRHTENRGERRMPPARSDRRIERPATTRVDRSGTADTTGARSTAAPKQSRATSAAWARRTGSPIRSGPESPAPVCRPRWRSRAGPV